MKHMEPENFWLFLITLAAFQPLRLFVAYINWCEKRDNDNG
jgi:hypothetical protein